MRAPSLPLALGGALLTLAAGCGDAGPPFGPDGGPGLDSGPPVITPGTPPTELVPRTPVVGQADETGPILHYVEIRVGIEQAILIENATRDVDVDFFDDSDFLDHAAGCIIDLSESTCVPPLAAGRRWIAIESDPAGLPVTYTVTHYPLVAQGSPSSPQPITDGYTATASATETSYFQFEVPSTGAYRLEFEDLYDPYGTSTATAQLEIEIRGPTGTVVASSTIYEPDYFEMSGLLPGTYEVDVTTIDPMPALLRVHLEQGLGMGAPSEPVIVTLDTPTTLGVDSWSTSYIAFTTGEAGTYYIERGPSFADPLVDVYVEATGEWVTFSGSPTENLEPDTTYLVELDGRDDRTWDLVITRGLSSGTEANPSPLPLDTLIAASNDANRSSYYAFVPTTTTSYRVHLNNTDDPSLMTWAYIRGPNDWVTSVGYCWEDPTFCVTPPLTAGETYHIEVTGEADILNFELSVTEHGVGEGTLADPIRLNVNEPRSSSISGLDDSYYRFTTDADGGPYVIAHSAGVQLSPDIYDPDTFWSSRTTILDNRYHVYDSLPGATRHSFRLRHSFQNEYTYQVAVLEHDVARPCAPPALFCAGFEASQSLVEFSEPARSASPFALSTSEAAVGTGSFESGNTQTGEESCFRLAPPSASWLLSFAARGAGTATDQLRVYVDDLLVHQESLDTATWFPVVLTTTYDPGHTYDVCYVNGSGGTGSDALWIDNLQLY